VALGAVGLRLDDGRRMLDVCSVASWSVLVFHQYQLPTNQPTHPPIHPPHSDPIGITSLYIGWGRDGATWVASEMKCLKDECVRFQQFPPGHYYSSKTGEFTRYYNPKFYLDFEVGGGGLVGGRMICWGD
jgi:hypothetical protein